MAIFDLKIGFPVKFPPMGLILRFQFWNLGPKLKKKKRKYMHIIQGSFENKVGMPGGLPYIPGVKYIQFLTRNPIFRSKIANSGT